MYKTSSEEDHFTLVILLQGEKKTRANMVIETVTFKRLL